MLLAASSGSSLAGLLPFVLLFVVMYFVLIRPQQRRVRNQQNLVRSISEGDEVVTTSGIYGYVTALEGDIAWVEIAEGLDIRIVKSAISRRVDTSAADYSPPTDNTGASGAAELPAAEVDPGASGSSDTQHDEK